MAKSLKQENCRQCDKVVDIFKALSKEESELLNQNRFEVEFNAGETILKQGTSFTHIICLSHGLVKVYLEGYDRRNLIIALIRGGELLDGPGMWTDDRHHFSVVAVENTTACFVEFPVFQKVFSSNSALAQLMIRRSNEMNIRHFRKMICLTQKQMHGKVADTLLYLNKNIYPTNPMRLTISRQDMADIVSLTKESLIRVLKEFREGGLVSVEGNEIGILDEKVLANISENG